MKKIIKALAVVMAAALLIVSFAACSGSSDANSSSATDATTAETAVQQADDVDYSDVALTIEDGDFDAMEKFLDAWGENKYDGKVIKITGVSERRMSNCTVMEHNDKGTGRGCSWEIIDGKFPDDYPEDDAKVTLTGVLMVVDDYGTRVLRVPAENVKVIK